MSDERQRAGSALIPPAHRVWKLAGGRELALGGRPRVMGILNVTPDSFSDGGAFIERDRAVAHGLEMVRQGADIIDVGGESTRPGAGEVSVEEELERTVPVVAELARRLPVPVSIDTTKAAVARAALDAGAAIINDISGFIFDPAMPELAVRSKAGLVVMHIRGTPRTMQLAPSYEDTVAEVCAELEERVQVLLAVGADPERIVVDPGIGFGKTVADNVLLLAFLRELAEPGYPVLLGCSRKSFLGALSNRPVDDRLIETVAATVLAAAAGCHVIRVHDVEENVRALEIAAAVLGAGNPSAQDVDQGNIF
jgi:dihydropteroate synthase